MSSGDIGETGPATHADNEGSEEGVDPLACPRLVEIVLVPAGGAKPSIDEGEQPAVRVRKLTPGTRYRVQVGVVRGGVSGGGGGYSL